MYNLFFACKQICASDYILFGGGGQYNLMLGSDALCNNPVASMRRSAHDQINIPVAKCPLQRWSNKLSSVSPLKSMALLFFLLKQHDTQTKEVPHGLLSCQDMDDHW